MSKENLPAGYTPFKEMQICSNSFIDGQVPIAIEGHPLFLIGSGDEVAVWLQLKVNDDEWEYVVSPNEITDSAFELKRSGRYVALYFGDHLILQANKESDELIVINHLDFLPLGFSIVGRPDKMMVGGMTFSGNVSKHVHTMVSVRDAA